MDWAVGIGFAIIFLSYLVFLEVDPAAARLLAREDGPVENLGAALSLAAAVLFFWCYHLSANRANRFLGWQTNRNLWFLALGLLMLACFGEEISWGQRIFGWDTPAVLKEANAQRETNLHNLWLFQAKNPDGTKKSSLGLLLNANRMLAIFWLVYCILIPLFAMASDHARRFLKLTGVPVASLAVGSLFIVNYVTFRSVVALGGMDTPTLSAFDELKETNYQLAFFVLALFYLMQSRSNDPSEVRG